MQATDCPRCGVIYAKAEAHAPAAAIAAPPADAIPDWSGEASDETLLGRMRAGQVRTYC